MITHPLCKSLTAAHCALREILQPGDTVVDATMGNGHDTLFLAQLIGPNGILHAFDIQQLALDNTYKRLQERALPLKNIHLHLDSHAHMDQYIPMSPKAIVFNLGYLPGSDKAIITHSKETLKALKLSTELLIPEGLLCVLCYPGHNGGNSEADNVVHFFKNLSQRSWLVTGITPLNVKPPSLPPFLLLAQKLN